MNRVKFTLESRGPINLVKRAHQVLSRFGPTPDRMGKRFDRFMDLLDRYNCRPSFPITALPMSRNPRFAHRLLERGAELAVHAFTHIDLTTLSLEQQSEHMGKAIQLFRKDSIPFTGFRAPYLHWNEDTMKVIERYQFRYSSNEVLIWDVIDREGLSAEQQDGWEKAKAFYKPLAAEKNFAMPSRRRGFVEIPVSLPDDEIMLDRMYMKDPELLGQTWQRILEKTHARGELFTLQLHPERIGFFTDALAEVLATARGKSPSVWLATLDEIAQWWVDKSGNTAEFVRENGEYTAHIKACNGTSLYLRENGVERVIETGDIHVRSDNRPCVGVAPGSERRAIQMLQDRGYIVDVGGGSEDFAIYFGKLDDTSYAVIRTLLDQLDAFAGPLLRFGAWPHGSRSAMSVTGDIDALTLWDFLHRFRGA
ncbi:MAG: polysaccharide deacetylase family protein [bacterium]|nr:polysaccharide deacetylase family protein [bacterium]